VRAIEDFIGFVKGCGDVRFARADRLADLVLPEASHGV
jgi:hypothetical protein